MTLFQALAKSEEMNCSIIHRLSGTKINATFVREAENFEGLSHEGWELDDTPLPIVFEGEFLGCALVEGFVPESTSFVVEGKHLTNMPVRQRVKVSLTPL